MDLKETCLDSAVVYQGSFMQVHKDHVRLPDGEVHSREYITHPGAVAVLAILDNGNLVMERQFRYAPQRELLEETGYVAGEWIHLTTAWPCIGYANERMEYFLARGLTHQGRNLDDGELLEVFELSLPEAIEWIRLGKINESKTIVGLFWLEKYLNGWQK